MLSSSAVSHQTQNMVIGVSLDQQQEAANRHCAFYLETTERP